MHQGRTAARDLLLWQSSGYGYRDRMGVLEEPSQPEEGMLDTKRQAGIRCAKKKYLKFFVENVT